jgi:hypothetical protein
LLAELLLGRLTGADDESAETPKGERDKSMSEHASNRMPQSGGRVLGKVRMVKVGLSELQSPAVNR